MTKICISLLTAGLLSSMTYTADAFRSEDFASFREEVNGCLAEFGPELQSVPGGIRAVNHRTKDDIEGTDTYAILRGQALGFLRDLRDNKDDYPFLLQEAVKLRGNLYVIDEGEEVTTFPAVFTAEGLITEVLDRLENDGDLGDEAKSKIMVWFHNFLENRYEIDERVSMFSLYPGLRDPMPSIGPCERWVDIKMRVASLLEKYAEE